MKRFMAAVAIIAATAVGALVVATPAQAGPAREHYSISVYGSDSIDYWYWIDELEGIIGCPKCYYRLKFTYSPEENPHWQGGVMEGLNLLSEARVAADERTKAALQARALESFTAAARALAGGTLRPGPASAFDPASGREFAIDAPWLDAAQVDIAAGLDALQHSFEDPSPLPWKQLAARRFDQAFTEIATKKAF
jgi:hypothetical protein